MTEGFVEFRWGAPYRELSWRTASKKSSSEFPSSVGRVAGSEPELTWSLALKNGRPIETYDKIVSRHHS